jgi:serine/threonine-protein kinase ATR
VFELGDDSRVKQAKKALQYAQLHKESSASSSLGAFIKPYMLGIMTHLNDTLHDMRGKKSSAYKCKIVKSLGRLIELVGGSMLFFTPQVSP